MRHHRVRCLLMGGQACVLYGAAEFSRDTDLAVLADSKNEQRLRLALRELRAEVIAVPPFQREYLDEGLAVHFRCHHPEAGGMRVDVMSRMRGVAGFPTLWRRRTSLELNDGMHCDLLSLPDLVKSKKTQRDKDWPMIRRLVEANYFSALTHHRRPTQRQLAFWLGELRTPELLVALAKSYPAETRLAAIKRTLLRHATTGDTEALGVALDEEMREEREQDQIYWAPLKRRLEQLRRERAPHPYSPH